MKKTENMKNYIMPAIFVGHGSPMNAIEENEFTSAWKEIADSIPTPKAILSISAHWETHGTALHVGEDPKTIHDFGGFPQALFNINYGAKGDPTLAKEIINRIPEIILTEEWGIDHGSWSILVHMYPNAEIPVIQLSINRDISVQQHYDLAKKLAYLREEGVLIMASGNIVHNLRLLKWTDDTNIELSYLWAKEFNETVKRMIINHKHEQLINYEQLVDGVIKSVPSPEHYIPLLYMLAIQNDEDKVEFFNDKIIMGSLSMTSVILKP